MKKVLLGIIVVGFIWSCDEKIKNVSSKESVVITDVDCFEYDGHEYLLFKQGVLDCAIGGVVHNPDCKCNKIKEDQP